MQAACLWRGALPEVWAPGHRVWLCRVAVGPLTFVDKLAAKQLAENRVALPPAARSLAVLLRGCR